MRIDSCGESINIKKSNFISNIVMRVYAICKQDSSFPLKTKIEDVESKILDLKEKIKKQDELLQQAEEIKDKTNRRIINIEKNNVDLQIDLLDKLGSEL
jgi:hypothetical protein